MIHKDIFEEYRTGRILQSEEVDISSDDGMWEYLDAVTAGRDVKWNYGKGKTVERRLCQELLLEKRIYIYGAGSSGGRTFKLLYDRGMDIVGFIDSSTVKQGTFYFGKRIWSPDEIIPDSCIILSCQWYQEIFHKLAERFDMSQYRIFVDKSNALFYSYSPLIHVPIYDWYEDRCDKR